MSLLGLSNFLLFQWFFFRLFRMEFVNGEVGYGVRFPTVPLSGWELPWAPHFIPRRALLFCVVRETTLVQNNTHHGDDNDNH